MRKNKLQAANLEGDADDIEAAFYDALQRGDIDRLMACWADEDEIFCIHPGGPRVVGATAIRATFESMFSDGGTVRAWPERARKIVAVGSAVHNVLERVEVLSPSHYSEAFADVAWRGKLTYVVPHFRGCSGEMNLLPRAYHSGDHEEIDFILRGLRARHAGPIVALGVSLGGNALLRWAAEQGT